MSANYIMKRRPPATVAAHSPINFTYRIASVNISASFDSDGKFGFVVSSAFSFTPAIGDRVYIYEGTGNSLYTGFHTITDSVSGVIFVTSTDYNRPLTGTSPVSLVRLPTITLYKGYEVGELTFPTPSGTVDVSDYHPYLKIADFKPEMNLEGDIKFDISGYAMTAILSPYYYLSGKVESTVANVLYNFQQWNRVRIVIENNNECELTVVNSSESQSDFTRYYVDTKNTMSTVRQEVFINGNSMGAYFAETILKVISKD